MTDLVLRKQGQILFAHDVIGKDALEGLKNGVYGVKITKQRNGKHHRKFFALLNFAYQNWDIEEGHKDFEAFRENITILAGHYKQVWDFNGNLTLRAKSISFGKMDQVEFDKFYSKVLDVILKNVLRNYSKDDLEHVVLELLRFD